MALRLGDIAPDFTAETTEGTIHFHDWMGTGWAVLFLHTANYTPVCATELGYLARIKSEFDKRDVKIIAIGVDLLASHEDWSRDIEETQGHAPNYPIIADPDHAIAGCYDLIHPTLGGPSAVRSVFIIGPDKRVRVTITYPPSTGRNFDEILRVIDSLQLTERYAVATPANWRRGDEVIIIPSLSDDEARKRFPEGWKTLKPYFRVVQSPR